MLISECDYPLTALNTFGLAAHAARFIAVESVAQLQQLISDGELTSPRIILGGGSNMLCRADIPGLVLQARLRGIHYHDADEQSVLVTAAAGENWDQLVRRTLSDGYSGLENLGLIPGTVGAAPVQNIGAYGVELVDRFVCLQAMDLETGEIRMMDAAACAFGYRESVFKQSLQDRWLILNVTLRLAHCSRLDTRYGAIETELQACGIREPTAADVYDAVCRIRRSKLPDPAVLGNAGSFFKNPCVSTAQYHDLLREFPEIVGYPMADGSVKLAAGWLIERAGLKGLRRGPVGVHERQSLVLVNYGGATGEQLLTLATEVQHRVHGLFGVSLTPEVRVLPFDTRAALGASRS